jgi:hypothetical protein
MTQESVAPQKSLQTDLVKETSYLGRSIQLQWTITPKAEYRIAARVLSTERYRTEWQSTFLRLILLGWGALSPKMPDAGSIESKRALYFYQWSGDSPYKPVSFKIIPQTCISFLPLGISDRLYWSSFERNGSLEGLLVNVDLNPWRGQLLVAYLALQKRYGRRLLRTVAFKALSCDGEYRYW